MSARTGLLGFFVATVLIALAYGSAFLPGGTPPWSPWLMAVGTALAMVSAMVFGASRPDRRLGPLIWVFAAAFVVIAGGFCLALALVPPPGGEPIWLGLPRRAAILIYGIGLLPVFLLPVAYAATFDRVTLSDADLASFRERLAAIRRRDAGLAGAENDAAAAGTAAKERA